MVNQIKVFAPATVANVTCGFDVLGFAIDAPGDELILNLNNTGTVRITKITGDDGKLPLEPSKNTAGAAILSMLNFLGSTQGVDIVLHKKMPFGSGLGSSAASAAASVVALNHLLNIGLSKQELVSFAMDGESVASGSKHADNVAPAVFGGCTLVRGYNPLDIVPIPTPENLYCSIILPDIEINTKEARAMLSPTVKLSDAITQWGNLAGLIAGFMSHDYGLISRSMQDIIIEPIRSKLIPGFNQIKQSALDCGALGAGISGSGPATFALSKDEATAHDVATAMQKACQINGLSSKTYVSKINNVGTRILD